MANCTALQSFRLLIGVVADSRRSTRARFLSSVVQCDATSEAGQSVDFAVVAYEDGGKEAWQSTAEAMLSAKLSRVRLVALLGRSNHSMRAKHVHRARLLNAAAVAARPHVYDAVWMLDGDISLARLDLQALLRRWRCPGACGKLPTGPAMIAQPTIEPATQLWAFNHEIWNQSLVESVRTRWIEQQVPLFDGAFVRWLHRQPVVRRILALQDQLDTSWGMDAIWCGAAASYLQLHPQAAVPCAVLTMPVRHDKAGEMPHRSNEERGLRLLLEAGLVPSACTNRSCVLHPWFRLPAARPPFKEMARHNKSLHGGWVHGGCLAGGLHAAAAVRARKWRLPAGKTGGARNDRPS